MTLDEIKNTAVLIIISMALIIVSGIGMGFIYYAMDVTASNFQDVSCTITNNVFVNDCQELFDMALYPFLALRHTLVILNLLFILMLTVGMLLLGYRSGKAPWTMGLSILLSGLLTYLALHVSNMYQTLLSNTIIYTMMIGFSVYNKIMLNFPWFVFFVSIISALLSIVNYQRASVNTPTGQLNY
ncbi:hypothetical protein KAT51_00915 [bacterium]|nr:hypothetical protein [bacterium]